MCSHHPRQAHRRRDGASRALSQFNFAENPAARETLSAEDRRLLELAEEDPEAAARAAAGAAEEWMRRLWESPEGWFDDVQLPESDRRYFEDAERRQAFLEAMREGVRQGPDAAAWEQIDCFLPWGFRLANIAIEVHVFHGEQDAWVERRHVDFLVETLPNGRLTVWPDSGHGPERHWDQILQAVALTPR